MIVIRPARLCDAEYLSTRLRDEDAREVETSTGQPAASVVPLSFSTSRESYAVFYIEPSGAVWQDPIGIFGVCDESTHGRSYGVVWFLGTKDIARAPFSIVRESKHWLDYMSRHYSKGLIALADTRNDLHIRWCKRTGFQEISRLPHGGVEFALILRESPKSV